jgi:hypothetical protein
MELINSSNKTFEHAQNKFIEFISSDNFTSKDPNKLNQEKLIQINKLGFLTIHIQYGNEIKRNHLDINSTHIEDRAFISGFMKKSMVNNFLKQIRKNSNIIVYEKIVTWYQSPVAIALSLDNKEIILNDKLTISPNKLDQLKKISLLDNVNNNDICLIHCVDIKFNRLANSSNGLFKHVINALEIVNKN